MKFKKLGALLLSFALLFSVVACSNNAGNNEGKTEENAQESKTDANENKDGGEKKEMIVFAAASMTEVLEELKQEFENENPNVSLTFNFDSSGTLKTQIEEGADVDVFISAAQKQMNALEEIDKIDKDSRIDLLENEVSLVVSEGNEKGIKEFKDLQDPKVEKIALGNEDVPVGQYSEAILKNLGIWDEIQGKVTFGSNVKEVTSWVSENVVDCGIIYKTDAKTAGLEVVAVADDSMLDKKVIYPAAILKDSKNKEEAAKYMEFLQSEKASEIFDKYGFKPLGK